jgi:hypothetical protein
LEKLHLPILTPHISEACNVTAEKAYKMLELLEMMFGVLTVSVELVTIDIVFTTESSVNVTNVNKINPGEEE